MVVELAKIIEALEYPDEWECFLDRNTGKVIAITDLDAPYIEGFGGDALEDDDFETLPQWHRESIVEVRRALATTDLLPLPNMFDFHEWDVMRRFATAQPEPARSQLLDAIHGAGAFRTFRRDVEMVDLLDAWYRFRDDALRQFATRWLDENGLAFSE